MNCPRIIVCQARRPFAALLSCVALASVCDRSSAAPSEAAATATAEQRAARTIALDKRLLNFPIKNGAEKQLVRLSIDGQPVREFEIELADGEADFWVFLDVGDFRGRAGVLSVSGDAAAGARKLAAVQNADAYPGQESVYAETLRPQFHFSSQRGWNNDPNGMVWDNGEYHLFYQHNPYGWAWGNMTWGHAVSRDLVHWTELPDAIHPDELGTIFSGSAVVDGDNTTRFQAGDRPPLVCVYTSAGGTNPASAGRPFTQSLAYSNDGGRTWTKYAGNPVQGHIRGGNRDPKALWHAPTKQWVIVLFIEDNVLGFFTSPDLKTWKLESELKSFYECPELFELAVDGDAADTKWVLYGGNGDYLLGKFDGRQFTPDGEPVRFSHGNCFYASQTFNNVPAADGRRIQIGWGRIDMPGMPFNQMMTFPVELTLRSTDAGPRLCAAPVREIASLRGPKKGFVDAPLSGEAQPWNAIEGQLLDIEAEFAPGEAEQIAIVVRGIEVAYDARARELRCLDHKAPIAHGDGPLRLRILADRKSLEIFADDGLVYMPMGVTFDDDAPAIAIEAQGNGARLQRLDVYPLQSIWPDAAAAD